MTSVIEEIRSGLHIRNDELCTILFQQQKNGNFCDVNLCIGTDKWMFNAHKAILAAKSPYFEVMFTSSFVEKSQETITIDPESEIIQSKESIECALEFVYTNTFTNPTFELMMDVCKIAELWMMEDLKKICEYFLAVSLTFENCETLLDFSKRNDCKILYNSSLRFILANLDEIAIKAQGVFDPGSSLFQVLKSLDIILPNEGETDATCKHNEETKTMIVFRKAKLDQYIFTGSLAKLTFPLENSHSCPIGLLYKISNQGLEICDFVIRLPSFIDLKMFGSKHCHEIVGSKIVSFAALGSDIYFGISNNNRFCGMLKYIVPFQAWDILPFIPGMIEARMTKTRTEYVTFFLKNTKEGPKLKVMNIQKNLFAFHENLLIIRSFEDGALVVENEIPKVNIPNGSLFYTSSPNVVQVGDELFFVFKYEILVLDSENLFHCITPRDSDVFDPGREDYRFYCVPVEELEELLILVHVKYNPEDSAERCYWKSESCKYRLNVFKYHTRKGFVAIPQPITAEYSYRTLQALYHDDTVYVAGFLTSGDTFVQSYNVMLNYWKEESNVDIVRNTEEYSYTNPVTLTGMRDDIFIQ